MSQRTVSIFATCIADSLFPQVAVGMVRILDKLGLKHDYPPDQTCCGQPAFNAGYLDEARQVGRAFIKAFRGDTDIVTPSGSCAAYVRSHLPEIFHGLPEENAARQVAERTYEISQYLVDVLGVTDLGAKLAQPAKAVVHNGCHGRRWLGLGPQPRALLENVKGLTLLEFERSEECCGFGGLFSVKMPHLSAAMMNSKIDAVLASGADMVLTGDAGCMMHLNGGLARRGEKLRVVHYAELIGGAL
jgi:L-lactate dehydrogenase complex protein LldE